MTFRMKKMLSLCEGTFNIPVLTRTTTQKSPVSDFGETRNTSALGRTMGRKRCAFEVRKF